MPRSELQSQSEDRAALVLLQIAATRAEIGPFARTGRETPQAAAQFYRNAAACPSRRPFRLA